MFNERDFSVVNSQSVFKYFIIGTVTTLQSDGLLLVVNLKVSHLVLPRKKQTDLHASVTTDSYVYSTDIY